LADHLYYVHETKAMRIEVSVKPNSKTEEVVRDGENSYTVRVKQPPTEGKANKAVIRLVAKHLGVPESQLTISKGLKSKNKTIEVVP